MSWWSLIEESDFARSIPLGNLYRPAGFSLAELPAGSMAGRVVLITGASSGLGRQTASVVAAAGATTVLGCRDETKGLETVRWIQEAVPTARVSVLRMDLASRRSVADAAAEFLRSFPALHVLINNAGIPAGTGNPLRTADGVEECFQVTPC